MTRPIARLSSGGERECGVRPALRRMGFVGLREHRPTDRNRREVARVYEPSDRPLALGPHCGGQRLRHDSRKHQSPAVKRERRRRWR